MNEVRLIDANALEKALDYARLHGGGVRETVRAAPTIDAVAVIRCKDCALRGTCDCPPWYANEWGIGQDVPGDNDFCSRGERRKE